jgi:hypothetical protein
MLWTVLAALLSVVGVWDQWSVTVPDTRITYLGGAAPAAEPSSLRVVPAANATALLFRGGFGFGSADTFRAALAAAPNVRLVVFDSPGGRPLVADEIAQEIRAWHLDTDVEHGCASACTLAFAAGTVRTANVNARFAFHRAASVVLDTLANLVYDRLGRTWFIRGGVSLSFANRALHAPNPTPYVPPLEELVAAGYLHRIGGVAVSSAIRPPYAEPLIEAMRRLEPQTAALLLLAERRRLGSGVSAEQARAITLDEAALVVDRWLSRSSDTAIVGLIDATLAALGALDPVSCMRWQVGIVDQDAGFRMIPPVQQHQFLAAEAAVLHDANLHPPALPTDSYEDADTAVRADITARYGSRALSDAATPEHAFDDPAKSCAVSIAYLRGLRDRPEGAAVLRWALAAG